MRVNKIGTTKELIKMKYWNINGYGYKAENIAEAFSGYFTDFPDKSKIGKSKHFVITRVSKKEIESYTKEG